MRGGHPWVFDRVDHVGRATTARPATWPSCSTPTGDFVAIGLYDPTSPIRVRILHHGDPAPIDDAFWCAADRRRARAPPRRWPASGRTTGYRCVHGENDGLPGLVVDRYDDTYVVKVYTAAWLPHVDAVVGALDALVRPGGASCCAAAGGSVGGVDGVGRCSASCPTSRCRSSRTG